MKNKNRFGNIALKSFIAVAVVIMLLTITPGEAINAQAQKTAKSGDPPLNELVSGVGAQANDNFGWNVSYAGDLNGDGISDLIVGAPFNDSADGSKTDCGAVYIFFGYSGISSGDLNAVNANITIYGANQSDHFGWSVSDAGNVDGDGDCVIIGAPDNDTADGSKASAGAVYIFNASAFTSSGVTYSATDANYTIYGENAGDMFGFSVSYAGNVDGASNDDIIIGAPGREYFYDN
ncbi:MAG: integrin alpha, partial [Thermoplasmatales archaeon]|nr:integrin alpha [Thermoplasmatales archaeon]